MLLNEIYEDIIFYIYKAFQYYIKDYVIPRINKYFYDNDIRLEYELLNEILNEFVYNISNYNEISKNIINKNVINKTVVSKNSNTFKKKLKKSKENQNLDKEYINHNLYHNKNPKLNYNINTNTKLLYLQIDNRNNNYNKKLNANENNSLKLSLDINNINNISNLTNTLTLPKLIPVNLKSKMKNKIGINERQKQKNCNIKLIDNGSAQIIKTLKLKLCTYNTRFNTKNKKINNIPSYYFTNKIKQVKNELNKGNIKYEQLVSSYLLNK